MNSLLEGILVLDFTHWIAGPYAGLFLADMGAEVIKIRTSRRCGRKTHGECQKISREHPDVPDLKPRQKRVVRRLKK